MALCFTVLHSPYWVWLEGFFLFNLLQSSRHLATITDRLKDPDFFAYKVRFTILVNSVLAGFWLLQDYTDLVIRPEYKGERISGYYIVVKALASDLPLGLAIYRQVRARMNYGI